MALTGTKPRARVITSTTGSVGGNDDGLPNVIIMDNIGEEDASIELPGGGGAIVLGTGKSLALMCNVGFASINIDASSTTVQCIYYNM